MDVVGSGCDRDAERAVGGRAVGGQEDIVTRARVDEVDVHIADRHRQVIADHTGDGDRDGRGRDADREQCEQAGERATGAETPEGSEHRVNSLSLEGAGTSGAERWCSGGSAGECR